MNDDSFEDAFADFRHLVDDARAAHFSGWDFSFMDGRFTLEPLPWSYTARVQELASGAGTMVDLGTGGGEFLAGLGVRAPKTFATEAWMPNVPIAFDRLRDVGVLVVAVESSLENADQTPDDESGPLPFRSDAFDLVIDRHECFRPAEVARILRPGGTFLTQQIGGRNEIELNDAFGTVPPAPGLPFEAFVQQVRDGGLEIVDAQERYSAKHYLDVGAIVYFLRAIPWQIEGLDLDAREDALWAIHQRIGSHGFFETRQHRFLIEARKP